MKYKSFTKKHLVMAALLTMSLFTVGCVDEDFDECYKLTLKVENVNGEDITESGDVSETDLYVFDENLNFLEKRSLDDAFIKSRANIVLNYPASTKLCIVAWGNTAGKNETVSQDQLIENLKVMLKASNSLAQSPDNLYYGAQLVTTKGDGNITGNDTIVIHPKVGRITVRTEGLQYALKRLKSEGIRATEAPQFYMNNTLSGYNYSGTLIGDSVYYNPDATWSTNGNERYTPVAKNTAAGTHLTFSVDVGKVTLGSVSIDDTGTPLATVEGKQTDVVIIFNEEGVLVSAHATVRPWGEVDQIIHF